MVQWHKHHTASIEVFIVTTSFVYTKKTTNHKSIHHINNRFRYCVIECLISINTFLHNHFRHFQAFFNFGHFVAIFAIKTTHFISRFHTHHTHTISTSISFNNDKWFIGNPFFIVFSLNFCQYAFNSSS